MQMVIIKSSIYQVSRVNVNFRFGRIPQKWCYSIVSMCRAFNKWRRRQRITCQPFLISLIRNSVRCAPFHVACAIWPVSAQMHTTESGNQVSCQVRDTVASANRGADVRCVRCPLYLWWWKLPRAPRANCMDAHFLPWFIHWHRCTRHIASVQIVCVYVLRRAYW